MKSIPLSTVAQWRSYAGCWLPQAIDTVCPSCEKLSSLIFELTQSDNHCNIYTGKVRCARCTENSTLVIVEPFSTGEERGCVDMALHPSPPDHRVTILNEVSVDERLSRAYQAALDAFNAGIWSASISASRRTLEGVVKLSLPEEALKGMLAQQLKSLPAHLDLTAPFLKLATALKDGGNLGAHFDLETEPDREIAGLILDFTEYVLEYLYVIPKHAESLRTRIERVD